MITFADLIQNLDDMVVHSGYIHTANAISMLYENDQLTEVECRTLRFQLSIKADNVRLDNLAQKLIGCERLEVCEVGSIFG